MHLTETIARSIAQTDYESIPRAVREKTKLSILDTLGVMVPPSTLIRPVSVSRNSFSKRAARGVQH